MGTWAKKGNREVTRGGEQLGPERDAGAVAIEDEHAAGNDGARNERAAEDGCIARQLQRNAPSRFEPSPIFDYRFSRAKPFAQEYRPRTILVRDCLGSASAWAPVQLRNWRLKSENLPSGIGAAPSLASARVPSFALRATEGIFSVGKNGGGGS